MTKYGDLDSVRDDIIYGEAYVSAELEVYIKKVFDEAPAADVAPVVHSQWYQKKMTVPKARGHSYVVWACSNCNEHERKRYNYCPNCGAKMDLED